jgi:uncharacterized protein (DUF2126 family)/transglutaminase-like putative cysteine protease
MAIRVALRHKTSYRYDQPVILFPHEIRLRPAPHARTPVLAYSLTMQPEQHFVTWQQDPYGNYIARFVFPAMTDTLEFTVDLIADMTVINPFNFFIEPYAEKFPFDYPVQLKGELAPYLNVEQRDPLLSAWIASARDAILPGGMPTVQFLIAINQRLQADIAYLGRMEAGVQAPGQTLALRQGSCRDSAWLLVHILREMGLAARFVSGYLIQLEADQEALDGPRGSAGDFTDLHAWAEVYIPGAGWIGLDATSGMLAAEGHIPLACTATPSSAAPVTGSSAQAGVIFSHEMSVTRIHETPRVGKPYSESAWNAMVKVGRQADAELAARGRQLWQQREHSFVSVDDMDGAEWNSVADSTRKRELASGLLAGLKAAFAPAGLLHVSENVAEDNTAANPAAEAWTLSLFWLQQEARGEQLLWPDCSWFAAGALLSPVAGEQRGEQQGEQRCKAADATVFADLLGSAVSALPAGRAIPLPEVRGGEGRLQVVMPALATLEDYLAVLGLVARTAAALQCQPILSGNPPPADDRLAGLRLAALPGAITVQLPAAASWDALVRDTGVLYREARLARLGGEKFVAGGGQLPGSESDILALGGSITPALLGSLMLYWQHHPALSYLFSGARIGPAGYAPRLDEAGEGKLYDFGLALQQDENGAPVDARWPSPWSSLLPDPDPDPVPCQSRHAEFALRHAHADASGRMQAGGQGQISAIDMRSFATPPHPQMSLLQALLQRTLAARFLARPYLGAPVQWGRALHDKWMLPHFLAEDMREVARDLSGAGYFFDESWFDSFIEWRFPRLGSAAFHGVELSLREALEPAGGGALQRVELSVRGLTDGRHVVACNGRMLPLHPTGTTGEFVAGVRFLVAPENSAASARQSQAAAGMRQASAPLTFDLVDTWNGRAIGGFRYHVRDPGGSVDAHAPVNANAAEARRAARFQPYGHTPGALEVRAEPRNPAMPLTLDLRWSPVRAGIAPA